MALMIVGTYHFARRPVGFRPDVCLSCEQETIAHELRSFDVGHFWWLPVLPLGFRHHWYCSGCGEDPRGERTSQAAKVAWIVLLLILGVVMWTVPPEDDALLMWGGRIGFPIVAALIARSIPQRKREDLALLERLRGISPIGHRCPLCGGPVGAAPPRRCGSCGAVEGRAPELAAS